MSDTSDDNTGKARSLKETIRKVRTAEAGHGGSTPGEEGYWLKHVAVDEFDMPWGRVKPGIDMKFMPTTAPKCGR